jgi:hypothetical protein
MRDSTSKHLCPLFLSRAGLAASLVLLWLGAAASRLAGQSDNFDSYGSIPPGPDVPSPWTAYTLPDFPDFGVYSAATFSFPTNPAGPAGNYAFRILAPAFTNDMYYGVPRAGAFRSDAQYGAADGETTFGRFSVQADLVAWKTNWPHQMFGLAWYITGTDQGANGIKGYVTGWDPADPTLGIARVDLTVANSSLSIDGAYDLLGYVTEGSTVLDPARQYRIVTSSHDGATFLATIYDLAQPNSPWQSVIAYDTNYYNTPGYCGIFEVNSDTVPGIASGNNSTDGTDTTWDNYLAYLPDPNAEPFSLPATVTDLYPPPAGKAQSYYPIGIVNIMNRDSNVDPDTIGVYMDGRAIPRSSLTISNRLWKPANPAPHTNSFPGATVTWIVTNVFPWGSLHTNKVVFQDDDNHTWHTNLWSWTAVAPSPFATNGSLSVQGFDVRLVQSYSPGNYPTYANIDLGGPGNSVAVARAVLNHQYAVNYAATNFAPAVNFDRYSSISHNGTAATNFPGLCLDVPDSYANSFAVEAFAYVQLPAGSNYFRVLCDDTFGIYTGASLTEDSVTLIETTGWSPDFFAFSWYVPVAGLYPIHIIMEEGNGGANLVLSSVDAGATNVVNTAASSVKAFYPLVVLSATAPNGPYTVDATANAHNVLQTADSLCQNGTGAIHNYTVTGGTLTIPTAGSSVKYYRLLGPRSTRFLSTTQVGPNLVITYQAN